MADSFQLTGSYTTTPVLGGCGTSVVASLCASLSLTRKDLDSVSLDVDTPVAVNFGSGVTSAAIVILKATGGKVRARLTSSDGAAQSVPVDDMLVLVSQSVPITALDLTRVPGIPTSVEVFLGQIT